MNVEPRPARVRGRPRASDSADTRERIVLAARDVFRELGYEGTTNIKIAQVANLTRPAINYHFASKRDLFRAVVEANLAILEETLSRAAQEPTLRSRLRMLITVMDLDADVRAAAGFLTAAELEYERHPGLHDDGFDIAERLRSFLTEAVVAALDSHEIRADVDVSALVNAFHAVLSGIAFRSGAVSDSAASQAQTDAVMLLLTGELFSRPSWP